MTNAMRRLAILSLAAAVALSLSTPAYAQGVAFPDIPGNGEAVFGQSPDGKYKPLQLDADGKLKTDATAGEGGGGDASAANQELQLAKDTLTAAALGAPANAACATSAATSCDLIQLIKKQNTILDAVTTALGSVNTALGTLNTSVNTAATLGAGSAVVGKVGIDQTTPGTTNAVAATLGAGSALAGKVGLDQTTPGTTNGTQDAATAATGGAAPAKASFQGVLSNGLVTPMVQASLSVPISQSTATTTQLIALSSGKQIIVTAWDIVVAGANNFRLVYGTGTDCATGKTGLTGAYNFAANGGIAKGNGSGPLLFVPASNALCAETSAANQASGSVSATQQ